MAAPDRDRLEQAAEHYETGDASAELERADYDDSTTAEPMVTTSLRLPKPVIEGQVRVMRKALHDASVTLVKE